MESTRTIKKILEVKPGEKRKIGRPRRRWVRRFKREY